MASPILWIMLPYYLGLLALASLPFTQQTYGLSALAFLGILGFVIGYCGRQISQHRAKEAFDDKKILSEERWNELLEVTFKTHVED